MRHFFIACMLFSQLTPAIEQRDSTTTAGSDVTPTVGPDEAPAVNPESVPNGGIVLDRSKRRTRALTNPDPAPVVPEGPPQKPLTADDVLRMPEQAFSADGTPSESGNGLDDRSRSSTTERSRVEPKQPQSTSYFLSIAIAVGIVLAILFPRRRRPVQ